jgi:hypothetical protein
LIGAGGWHLVLGINVPLSLMCLALGALWLPRVTPPGGARRIDVPGMLWFAGSLTAFMFFLMPDSRTLVPASARPGHGCRVRPPRTPRRLAVPRSSSPPRKRTAARHLRPAVPRPHHVVRLLLRLQPVAPEGPRTQRLAGRSASAAAVGDGARGHRADRTP